MARTDPTIYMRMPAELKDALDKAALENKRSLTAEVVARLQSTLAGVDTWAQAFPHAAEAAFGRTPASAQDEAMATLHRMELSASIDRVRSMEAQLVQLEAQSQQVDLERGNFERWMEQASSQGNVEDHKKWRDDLERVIPILIRLDKQVVATQRALKEERAALKLLQAKQAQSVADRK